MTKEDRRKQSIEKQEKKKRIEKVREKRWSIEKMQDLLLIEAYKCIYGINYNF